MEPSFLAHVQYDNTALSDAMNFFEEYCSVLNSAFGQRVQQYKQVDEKNIVPVSAPQKDWEHTVAKIAAVASLLIPVIPLFIFAVRWGNRKICPLNIQPPAYAHPEKHDHLEKAREIRNVRENGVSNDDFFNKKLAHHFRKDLPADLIIDALFPREENENKLLPVSIFGNIYNPKSNELNFIGADLRQKQDQILQDDFNSFKCVQGVEGLKGGIRNLLNIMLEGVVRSPCAGALMKGPADYCAGSHGPYYVILASRALTWDEDAHIAYLVPAQEHRDFLEGTLAEAEQRGYITEEERLRILSKVITYNEFISLPHKERHSEQSLKQWLEIRESTLC